MAFKSLRRELFPILDLISSNDNSRLVFETLLLTTIALVASALVGVADFPSSIGWIYLK